MWFEIPSSFAPSPFPSLQPNFSSSFWPNLESSANISKIFYMIRERKKERLLFIYGEIRERNNYISGKLHYYPNHQRLTRKFEICEFYMYVFTRNSLKDSTWNSYAKIYHQSSDRCQVTSYKDHFEQRPPRTKNPCSKWLLCFCTKWSPLYEVVFVRNGLCTKWLSCVIRLDTWKYHMLQFCMAFFYNKDKQ